MEIWPIQQDEWLAGYLGRLAAVNSCTSQLQVIHRLDDFSRRQSLKFNYLEFLASLHKMSVEQLVYGHTLYRLHKAFPPVSFYKAQGPVFTKNQLPYVSKWFNAKASFCPICVEIDKERNYFAHWRRSHQIPGIWHCVEHQVPLKWVSIRDPMNFTPCKCTSTNTFDVGGRGKVLKNGWIESTHQVLLKILDSEHTIDQPAAFSLLREVTSLIDSKGALLKDSIAEIVKDVTVNLPSNWLKDYFPKVRNDANNYEYVLGSLFTQPINHRNGSPTTKIALLTARYFPPEVAVEILIV